MNTENSHASTPWYKNWKIIVPIIVVLAIFGMINSAGDDSADTASDPTQSQQPNEDNVFQTCQEVRDAGLDELTEDHERWNPSLDRDGDGIACESTPAEEEEAEDETVETETETVENDTHTHIAEGVDPYMGPQDWWDEHYRSNNCASQDIRFGGIATCMARGTDMDNDDTMLVFYVDQNEPGVQEHFEMEQRRQMFVDSLAGLVMAARYDGDVRLNHVTDVRVIASGGEGFFSGWQGEAAAQ